MHRHVFGKQHRSTRVSVAREGTSAECVRQPDDAVGRPTQWVGTRTVRLGCGCGRAERASKERNSFRSVCLVSGALICSSLHVHRAASAQFRIALLSGNHGTTPTVIWAMTCAGNVIKLERLAPEQEGTTDCFGLTGETAADKCFGLSASLPPPWTHTTHLLSRGHPRTFSPKAAAASTRRPSAHDSQGPLLQPCVFLACWPSLLPQN